jgi:hypothetical protein
MNRLIVCLFFLTAGCLAPEPTHSAKPNVEIPNAEAIEAQAQAAASASKPRKEHHALEALVGSWQTRVVTVDANDVESDPHPGSAAIESLFSGRYLRWEAMLDLGTETHVTTGYLGFDANQTEYQLLMISDLSTGMGVAHGRGDLKSGGIRFVIEIPDPESGALRRAVSNLRLIDGNHFLIDQFGADANGRERVVRRTHYERVKK